MKRFLDRRAFLKLTGTAAALPLLHLPLAKRGRVALVVDPDDAVANASAVQWALSELEQALKKTSVEVVRLQKPARELFSIIASGSQVPSTQAILKSSRIETPKTPESFTLLPTTLDILACGSDARGLVYAILELCDRLNTGGAVPFNFTRAISERPYNSIRSVLRLFASDVEDKPWFNNKEFWSSYLTMLATQRFNRFNLSLSLGYDFLRRVTDAYFLFPYPFLFSVPGYNVRVPQLSDTERDSNLGMLRFIGEQTVSRGLDFQLGLWMHGYEWIDSPKPNYTIEGLTKEKHAAYCRDALRQLLQSCPAISGVTLRTHGESGVDEGSYEFWKTIFDGVATCGRRVEIDLHPKGLDETMLNNALGTKQPITVSPKYWAEHLGLPYHQADIRQLEVPDPKKQTSRLMNLSEGSRSFMRYGYGDLLREDRTWKVIHRVWPGSQRLLLWGDPVSAAAYAKSFNFCASDGAELMEPLTFKGRRGSGLAGDRCSYLDKGLQTRWDWQKYEYTYRIWGRLVYNPSTDPDGWQRYTRKHFGKRAGDLETALASASRILPLITTAHLPSAANNNYWPELYTNHSLFDAANRGSYSDTPAPRVFGNVSPLDPQLFYSINDYVDDVLNGNESGKYSPLEVATWLEDDVESARASLAQGVGTVRQEPSGEFQRWTNDVIIQIGLGRFFAAKLRAAVLYRIFEKTGEQLALTHSVEQYRNARNHWAEFANIAKNIYVEDIKVGELPQQHGHWIDRIPAIEKDIETVANKRGSITPSSSAVAMKIVRRALSRNERSGLAVNHTAITRFERGKPLQLDIVLPKPITWARLHYRHVNQAERFVTDSMEVKGSTFKAIIPGEYTNNAYPLQYYFELKPTNGSPLLYPGFNKSRTNQPYLVASSGAFARQ